MQIPPVTDLGDESPPLWRGEMEQVVIQDEDSFSEVVFFHRPTKTLVLTDLAFNGVPDDSWWQRFSWRLFGIPADFGPSRSIRWALLRWLDTLDEHLAEILAWDFEHITVTHGPPVLENARETFLRGFAGYVDRPMLEEG